MNNFNKSIPWVLLFSILIGACNLPAAGPEVAEVPQPILEELPAPLYTPTPTAAVIPIQDCNPNVTTTTIANVRGGPGTNYNIVGVIPLGGTAPVAGKNADSTWWYIQFAGGAGGYAWIAGSVTTAACIPATLAIIAAPPAPAAANNPAPADSNDSDESEVSEEPTDPPSGDPGDSIFVPGVIFDGPIFILPSPTPTLCVPCLINPEINIPIIPIGP